MTTKSSSTSTVLYGESVVTCERDLKETGSRKPVNETRGETREVDRNHPSRVVWEKCGRTHPEDGTLKRQLRPRTLWRVGGPNVRSSNVHHLPDPTFHPRPLCKKGVCRGSPLQDSKSPSLPENLLPGRADSIVYHRSRHCVTGQSTEWRGRRV